MNNRIYWFRWHSAPSKFDCTFLSLSDKFLALVGGLNLRLVLRWAFLALGMFLIIRADLAPNAVLALRPYADLLTEDARTQNIAISVMMIAIMPSGLLCIATSLGLKANRRWARWTGLLACVLLLLGLPWFSLVGLTGICLLLIPLKVEPLRSAMSGTSQDYWMRARDSRSQRILLIAAGALLIPGLDAAWVLARREGLPEYGLGWSWWLYLIPLALLNTTIHEFSHAFTAWAFHQRLKVVSIGPFTWSRNRYGISFRMQWTRLLETGGYVGAIPTSEKHLRLQQVAVCAAGPLSSAFTSLAALTVFLGLPGSGWENYWEVLAIFGVIAFDYALVSAVPLGYSDGSMVLHLIAGTDPGKVLLNTLLLAQMDEDADADEKHADFEKNLEARQLVMDRAQQYHPDNSMLIAACHQKLAYAKSLCEEWVGAEREFRTCAGFEVECEQNEALGVNTWALLHETCVKRHNLGAALAAYPRALELLQKRNQQNPSRAVPYIMLGEFHLRPCEFEEALSAATAGLRVVSKHRRFFPLQTLLLAVAAESKICLGKMESGVSVARTAASMVRSADFPIAERNIAFSRIAELGNKMWRAGQPGVALELLREAIQHLERAGAVHTALRHKIRLAAILRQHDRAQEARALLPDEDGLPSILLGQLLWERATLLLSEGCNEGAVADCLRLIELRLEETGAEAEVALAESLLAVAYLEQGKLTESGALASKAIAVLGPWKHYEAVRCRITLALATGERISDCIEESINQTQADPLLRRAEKARVLDNEARRLERHSRPAGAIRLRQVLARPISMTFKAECDVTRI